MRTALFWGITQRVVVISCWSFGTTSRSHLQGSRLIGCPETSVINYHYSLRDSPEERSSHLLRGGSLQSVMYASCFGLYLYHPRVCQYKYLKKGRYNNNLRGPFSTVTIFIMFVCFWRISPPVGPGLLFYEVSRSHTTTHHSRYDSSGRLISSSQRPLPDNTQHSQ